jgi:hypothetical protein
MSRHHQELEKADVSSVPQPSNERLTESLQEWRSRLGMRGKIISCVIIVVGLALVLFGVIYLLYSP